MTDDASGPILIDASGVEAMPPSQEFGLREQVIQINEAELREQVIQINEAEEFVKAQVFSRDTSGVQKSKQIADPALDFGNRAISPPYNPLLWAELVEKSTRLSACIHAMALNTVGLGWEIVPIEKITKDTPEEIRREIQRETSQLEAFFNYPNPDMPLVEVFGLEKIDEESTGNGYVEVLRNLGGLPSQLHHIPSHTMRVDREGGFVQMRIGRKRFFKDFGGVKDKHCDLGTWHEPGSLSADVRATEVIHFKLYTPRDSYYGIPRVVCAAPSVTGNRLAAIRNAAFFDNDAVPRLAILISGGHLTDTAAKSIKEFLHSDAKGPFNAHRVMVVEAEGKKVALGGKQEPVKIALEKLTVGETDDSSFQEYRKQNDNEIREAFRIGAIFLGTSENVNRASATISRRITIDQVFVPEQIKKEYVINQKLLRAFNVKHTQFRFKRPVSEDPVDRAPADNVAARYGALTPNDLRQERGLDPYPSSEPWADKPFDLARIEFQAKFMGKPAEGPDQLARSLLDIKGRLTGELQAEATLGGDDEEPEVTA